MIQSSFTENRSVHFRILSDDQIWEIKRAALDVLEKTGCRVRHKGARRMLKKAGALVKGEIVRLPEFIVRRCLETAPKGITIYDREGKRAMEVEGRKTYYGTATASPNTRDALTGEIHETLVEDIARGALVADALPNIDWVMPMGSSQDVPPILADLYEFEATLTHTTKPIVWLGYSRQGIGMVLEMAAEVAGGFEALRERPFVITQPDPITPLVFPEDAVERIFVSAECFIPQIAATTQQLGATAPVTLAGTLVLGLAEGLMNVTLAQLKQPGAPCFLGINVGTFDMTTFSMSIAAPEVSLGLAAQAEVAQSFGLPTWGLAGATDAKTLDAQAGMESTFSLLAQGLAGLNLIHDVGYMDRGMICSAEMLVLGDEAIGMVKRFIQGFRINAETLAREVIERVGPGGHFLDEDHTFQHFREELWVPKLLSREPYDLWVQRGSKDMGQRVAERVREIIEAHRVPALPEKTLVGLEKIRLRSETELVPSAA